jgi:hypothetical protein
MKHLAKNIPPSEATAKALERARDEKARIAVLQMADAMAAGSKKPFKVKHTK